MHKSLHLATITLATLLPGAVTGQVLNARLKSGQVSLRNICVMPVESEWKKVGLITKEPKLKEADELSIQLRHLMLDALAKAGAHDSSEGIVQSGPSQDENLRPVVLQLQQKFDAIVKLERRGAGGIKKGKFTLGDQVSLLPCAAHADALLFVRAQVNASLVSTFGTATLLLAFVDAKSGELLTQTTIRPMGDAFQKSPEIYFDLLVDRFHRMRVGK